MDSMTLNSKIERISGTERKKIKDTVIREYPLTIFLNNKELVTLLCSPTNLDYLAIGFLQSEGFIKDKTDIIDIKLDARNSSINITISASEDIIEQKASRKRTLTTGCGKGTTFNDINNVPSACLIDTPVYITPQKIRDLINNLQQKAINFKSTGAAHVSGLASNEELILAYEDIGRHNALDKLFGKCVLDGIRVDDKIIVTSGRISTEMIIKCAKRRIPILISRSAPTSLAIEFAKQRGLTLIGFVRGERINIYANGWRVK